LIGVESSFGNKNWFSLSLTSEAPADQKSSSIVIIQIPHFARN